MSVIWGEHCKANQQLLSITSAPSGVISKQTDWNRPTEASSRGKSGMDRGERLGAKDRKAVRRRWEGVNTIREMEDEIQRSSAEEQTVCNLLLSHPPFACSKEGQGIIMWGGAACRIVQHATGNSNHLLSFTFSPFPWHPSSCSLPPSYQSPFPSQRLTEQVTTVRVKMKGLRGGGW